MKPNSDSKLLIGVDAGSSKSGVVIVNGLRIVQGENVPNEDVFSMLERELEYGGHVLVEDMMPYTGQISPYTIATCKFLGELEYRLKAGGYSYELISRSSVKEWVFKRFHDVVVPMINKRIENKGRMTKDGVLYKASHVYVDDRAVIAAMRVLWGIPAETGKKNRYGWNQAHHAWQALALVSYHKSTQKMVPKKKIV